MLPYKLLIIYLLINNYYITNYYYYHYLEIIFIFPSAKISILHLEKLILILVQVFKQIMVIYY